MRRRGLDLFILSLFLSTTATAQLCTDYVENEMKILGTVNDGNRRIYNVAVEGDVAFMTGPYPYVYAVDISDPAGPEIIGTYTKTMSGSYLAIKDGLICLVEYNDDVQFLDATDPTNMTLIKTLPNIPAARRLIAHGDYFYIAGGNSGLTTVDASDPTDPVISSVDDPEHYIANLAIKGNYLYTVGWQSPMCVYSLADPSQPVFITDTPEYYSGTDLEIVGDYIYRTRYQNPGHMGIYQIDPESGIPSFLGTQVFDFDFRFLARVDNTLFCTGEPFINALDLSDPANPRYTGRMLLNEEIGDVVPYGNVLLCNVAEHILVTVDVSQTESTIPDDIWSNASPAYDLEFHDDLYLWAAGGDGLQIWEYGEYPQTASVALSDTLYAVKRDGDLAYLAIDEDGLQIADISDPANPFLVGGVNSSSQSRDVDVYSNDSGTYALLAVREQDLIKYDVTDPADIHFYGLNSFPGFVYAVEVVGNHLLVADTGGHLNAMDLSVFPDQPEVVSILDLPGGARSMYVEGDICYIGGENYLAVVDISDPGFPILLGDTPTRLPLTDLQLEVTVVYAVMEGFGMAVIEAGNPADLFVRNEFPTQSNPLSVGVYADQVHLGTLSHGLVLLPLQCSTSTSTVEPPTVPANRGIAAYPNPFNPRTTIGFSCRRSGPVQLAVYDLAGRRIAEIVDNWLEAGSHEREWNGRDGTGRAVASGPYMVRLKTLDGNEVQKVLLSK